jgi:hypothetical protein
MKNTIGATLILALGIVLGAMITPIFAQQDQQRTCFVGEGSNAACSGDWIFFAGNTTAIDNGAWIVRIDARTGAVWLRDGNDMERLREPE